MTSSSAEIRAADTIDIPGLAWLRWRMHSEEQEPEIAQDEFVPRFQTWASRALLDERWRVWVGVVNRELIGHVYLERIDKVPRPKGSAGGWGYLTGLYVEPRFRNGGIGRRLLETAIEWAFSVGLEFIQVWPSDRSVPLYRRVGFASDDESLILRLGSAENERASGT